MGRVDYVAAKEQPMKVKLKVMRGKSAGKEIPIPAPRFLIGRSNDCHLRPKSDSISRNHCTIMTRDNQVWVRDLNSRNGTFVNGERITEEEEVRDGDQLQIGKLEFVVVVKAGKKAAEVPAEKAKQADLGQAELGQADTDQPDPALAAGEEPGSLDFDVSEWLQEADPNKAGGDSPPETRQFQLDDTDRLALSEMSKEREKPEEEEKESKRPKRKPGKLPARPANMTNSSRDAAADMLKKFFNSR